MTSHFLRRQADQFRQEEDGNKALSELHRTGRPVRETMDELRAQRAIESLPKKSLQHVAQLEREAAEARARFEAERQRQFQLLNDYGSMLEKKGQLEKELACGEQRVSENQRSIKILTESLPEAFCRLSVLDIALFNSAAAIQARTLLAEHGKTAVAQKRAELAAHIEAMDALQKEHGLKLNADGSLKTEEYAYLSEGDEAE